MKKQHEFATRAIHAGQEPDPSTGAIMTPIYATSTYVQESPGKHKGYDYARSINPTRLAYEKCIADLESGTRGFAFASGLAAMATVARAARERLAYRRERRSVWRHIPIVRPECAVVRPILISPMSI